MIDAPRVLVLTRRFWPQATDGTYRLLNWANALQQRHARVTILTPRWSSQWPISLVCREIPVWRVQPPPSSPFRIRRYARSIANWVRDRAGQFDVIYCDTADVEAEAILAIPLATMPPVVVRFDPVELSQTYWRDSEISPLALQVCRRARCVIAPRATALQRLVSAGIPIGRIARLSDGVTTRVQRTESLRLAARKVLADINQDLFLRSTDRLVVCPTDLDNRWAIEVLISAMGPLLESHRSLRLWLLGEGNQRARVYESLKQRDWHNLVAMPGSFEDMEEVIQASDLWIIPTEGVGTGWLVPTALASGLPTLVCAGPDILNVLPGDQPQLTFPTGDARDLQRHVRDWLDNPQPTIEATTRARNHIIESLRPLDGWDTLLNRL